MIDNLKKNFITFVQGIMFGFGFCIAASVLYFAFQAKTQETHEYRGDTTTATSSPTKDNQFAFRDVEEIKRNGRSYFIGRVKNNGSFPASGVSIEINLFLKNKFVDQYSSYITGDIGPGEERYFKVSCGCKEESPTEHDSYKVGVVGSYKF
ncbi:FxLYD domain-containing protein [Undibacterium macrobrachii]|jgi:hypothetical protein|uniref:Cytochrome c maturation protein CcmE n=1 Tax=Undibacterium macrobrachii TaxID=1119058 RepID=A0ABQ2XK74_9BURK|nr:FxLYD domain-containing protein [Undibacterium macrobrachii]GGX20870.1 hypothetical protein GCM10011282_28750 [Undibacterium macrobrachii]